MVKPESGTRVYIVINVMRGVALGTYCFRRLKDARTCFKRLRKGRILEQDDVQIFETTLAQPAKQYRGDGESCVQLTR